jgi:hypothetical protein
MAYEHQEKQLGMDRPIARRDFLNGAAIAACATCGLLRLAPPCQYIG